jgi:hypothetical protein
MGRIARIAICVVMFALVIVPSRGVVATAQDGFGTPLVRAGSWLGGRGVTVYSNGSSRLVCAPARGSCENRIGPRGVDTGLKWQCVELAQRLYIRRGWFPMRFGVRFAYQIWWAAPRLGMTRFPNGTLSRRDLHPGDMIVWGPSGDVGPAGHVGIVDWVAGSQVAVMEQNWGRATTRWDRQRGASVYALAGGWLNGHSLPPGDIYGVVHSPRDHLRNADVVTGGGVLRHPDRGIAGIRARRAIPFVV